MGDAIVWWIALQLLGLAAIPIAAVLLRALPDRGYTMSKPLGLLLAGWLAYALAMLKVAQFDRLLVIICLLLVACFSLFLLLRRGRTLLGELRDHYTSAATLRYVLVAEVLFALAFVIWAVVRAYQPDILDQEKFMDFGFLNSILKSGTFPPNDQWLAGFSINYYYFGYILMAALTALSGVPTQVAFNLANVGLFALTALGAFGVVYNLISSRLLVKAARASKRTREEGRRSRETEAAATTTVPERRLRSANAGQQQPVATKQAATAQVTANALPSRRVKAQAPATTAVVETEHVEDIPAETSGADSVDGTGNGTERREARSAARDSSGPAYLPAPEAAASSRRVPFFLSPYLYAVLAALMVVAMGNLTAMFAIHDGNQMEGNGYRFCFACNSAQPGYDWFGASRVVADYKTTEVPGQPPQKELVGGYPTINEFPAFSFLLADLHPHVIALPFVLLAVSTAFALGKRRVIRVKSWRDGVPPGLEAWVTVVLAGLIAGSLYTINTWDFPTYLLAMLLCLGVPYLAAGRRQGLGWRWLQPYLVQALLIVVFGIGLFLPFHLTFKSLVGGGPVQIPANLANIPLVGWLLEKLGSLVLINGADKTIVGFLVIFGIFLVPLLVWLGFEFASYFRRRAAAGEDIQRSLYLWAGFLVLTLLAAFLFRFPLLALLLPIVTVSLTMAWKEPRRTERNIVLILVGLAALIGLVIEVVYLRDNFQTRMNTLFKFYYQIWILWALAAAYGFWRVLFAAFGNVSERVSRDRNAAQNAGEGSSTGVKVLSGAWAVVVVLLVLSGLMYTYYGVAARQIGGRTAMQGLDGTTWLRRDAPGDYDAINWLKENGTGQDRVLETGHDEYHRPGRVSAYSGVPTLIAWDTSHERLWRTNQPDALAAIGDRRNVTTAIYQGVDPNGGAPLTAERLLELLKQYAVTYIFVGATERGEPGFAPESANEQVTAYAEAVFKQALPEAFRSGSTVIYAVKDTIAGTGVAPATPAPGITPGVNEPPDPNVPPVGLFDAGTAGHNRGELNLPRDITRDADGNFYVTDTQNERIQKFDKDGKWVAIFGGRGKGDGQFGAFSDDPAVVGTGPGGIAVDAEGNVYVADTWNHRIQKFDKDGKFITKWGTFINLADPGAESDADKDNKFFGPRGVAIGPDGNIYTTDTGNKRVLIFDPNGKFVREISSGVTSDKTAQQYPYNKEGEMNEPIGIAVDQAGNVYVADVNNRRIQKFDAQGKFAAQWAVPAGAWDPGPYLEPYMALDGAGNIYTTAPTSKSVIKFSPAGAVLGEKSGNGTISLKLPTGIAVDPDGTVYVVDTNGSAVMNLGQIP
ncbi:MAG: DUF2298 domain-containing protein [Chloroflexota bacterium]